MEKCTVYTEKCPEIHYRKIGDGAPLMLLHGFPEDGDLWRLIWDALAEEFMVLVPDLPGSGSSQFIGERVTIDELAGAMWAILDAEEQKRVVVAGHSMGGYVALAMAEQRPEEIAGLSLVHATTAADSDARKQLRQRAINHISRGERDSFLKDMIPNLFSPVFREQEPMLVSQQLERGLKLPSETLIAFYEAIMGRPDRTDVIKTDQFPIQFICGKDDTIAPFDTLVNLADLPAFSFVSVYDEVGHMSMLERPDSLAADIASFAATCWKAVINYKYE